MITVYTLPDCVQCDSTKRVLSRQSVDFKVVDISQDTEALNMVRSLGYTSAPVVIAGDDHWSGFRLDKLKALKTA